MILDDLQLGLPPGSSTLKVELLKGSLSLPVVAKDLVSLLALLVVAWEPIYYIAPQLQISSSTRRRGA
jgi:hypothetical protein